MHARTGDCYEPLVTPEADSARSQFGGELEFAGASPDLHHVLFSSDVPLTSAPSAPGLYEWNAEKPAVGTAPAGERAARQQEGADRNLRRTRGPRAAAAPPREGGLRTGRGSSGAPWKNKVK